LMVLIAENIDIIGALDLGGRNSGGWAAGCAGACASALVARPAVNSAAESVISVLFCMGNTSRESVPQHATLIPAPKPRTPGYLG
ncbi:MAG: hypothetical protein WAN68_20255, partial [Pseudolabrys sp.]